ncbi:nucleoside transporter C-terminal domain-containing protein [Halobacillus hunanensis]|uniref:nucleoside transporter C-terminal domain-containing protein n=1 Tax=Halobacillus hunanensis TaxID=578214 RepID=UPI001FEBF9AA|nr:nucleoside transporter C-terminal domain-containing protein [Halobacillus hunanensis]
MDGFKVVIIVAAMLLGLWGFRWAKAVQAGGNMATKIVTNEFVAMLSFGEISSSLSEKTVATMSALAWIQSWIPWYPPYKRYGKRLRQN